MNKIKQVHRQLCQTYGKQGWWPLTPDGKLESEHHQGRPLNDKHRFEIIVGAILTQNTAWTNVEKALLNLNRARLNNISKIAKAKQEKIGVLIRPAGYYNQKSERLKIVADFFLKNGFSEMQSLETKELRSTLLAIKGIGPETADSILLYAFEKPSFVIDAYTKRIMSRIGLCTPDASYDELQNLMMDALASDVNYRECNVELFKEYHALIVEHAKQHCRTKPICDGCCLSKVCEKKI